MSTQDACAPRPLPIRVVTQGGNQYKLCPVKLYMRHIYEKLQVNSKSEAVAKAMREWLIN